MCHIYNQLKISSLYLFVAANIFAVPAVVQRTSCVNGGRVASLACTFGSAVTTGNTVAVGVVDASGSGTVPWIVTDNNSATFANLGFVSGCNTSCVQLSALANVTGRATYTVTATEQPTFSGFIAMFLVEYSGMPSTLKIDQQASYVTTAGAFTASATPNCGTMWATNSSDVVISAMSFSGGGGAAGLAGVAPFTANTFAQNYSCCSAGGLEDTITTVVGEASPKYTASSPAGYKCANAALAGAIDSPGVVIRQSHANCLASGSTASNVCTFLTTPLTTSAIIVVAGSLNGAVTGYTVTDNQATGGNTYASIVKKAPPGQSATEIQCATSTKSSGTFSVTVTPTGTSPAIMNVGIFEVAGITCVSDGTQTAGTTTVSPYSCGSLTTTGSTDYVVSTISPAAASPGSGATATDFSASSGFTMEGYQLHSDGGGASTALFAVQDRITGASGTFTPQFSSTSLGSSLFICASAAFKVSSGGVRHRVISQ